MLQIQESVLAELLKAHNALSYFRTTTSLQILHTCKFE